MPEWDRYAWQGRLTNSGNDSRGFYFCTPPIRTTVLDAFIAKTASAKKTIGLSTLNSKVA